MYDPVTDKYNEDRDSLGQAVDCLVPCLDPATPVADRTSFAAVSERTNLTDSRIVRLQGGLTGNELASTDPHYWEFVPSPEIEDKLFQRMLELKNPIKELWHGFPVPLWRSTHPAEDEDDDEVPGDGTASPS